jgi:hypothetical protein
MQAIVKDNKFQQLRLNPEQFMLAKTRIQTAH